MKNSELLIHLLLHELLKHENWLDCLEGSSLTRVDRDFDRPVLTSRVASRE